MRRLCYVVYASTGTTQFGREQASSVGSGQLSRHLILWFPEEVARGPLGDDGQRRAMGGRWMMDGGGR